MHILNWLVPGVKWKQWNRFFKNIPLNVASAEQSWTNGWIILFSGICRLSRSEAVHLHGLRCYCGRAILQLPCKRHVSGHAANPYVGPRIEANGLQSGQPAYFPNAANSVEKYICPLMLYQLSLQWFYQDGPCWWCQMIKKVGYTMCLNAGTSTFALSSSAFCLLTLPPLLSIALLTASNLPCIRRHSNVVPTPREREGPRWLVALGHGFICHESHQKVPSLPLPQKHASSIRHYYFYALIRKDIDLTIDSSNLAFVRFDIYSI